MTEIETIVDKRGGFLICFIFGQPVKFGPLVSGIWYLLFGHQVFIYSVVQFRSNGPASYCLVRKYSQRVFVKIWSYNYPLRAKRVGR